MHESTHGGHHTLADLLAKQFVGMEVATEAKQIAQHCMICAKNNPKQQHQVP